MCHNLKLTIEVGGRTMLRILYADSSTDNWVASIVYDSSGNLHVTT